MTLTPKDFRLKMLDFARADIGKGEEGMNNWGPYVQGLLDQFGINIPAAWCAAFMWKCISQVITWKYMDHDMINAAKLKTPSALDMYNKAKAIGWVLPDGAIPEPGDIMIIRRGADGSWFGHAGIVADRIFTVSGIPEVIGVIEGNIGPFPAKVKPSDYKWPIKNLVGFIRILG